MKKYLSYNMQNKASNTHRGHPMVYNYNLIFNSFSQKMAFVCALNNIKAKVNKTENGRKWWLDQKELKLAYDHKPKLEFHSGRRLSLLSLTFPSTDFLAVKSPNHQYMGSLKLL